MKNSIKVLCLGDVVGRAGRTVCTVALTKVKEALGVDFTVINGENSSGGVGIDIESAREIRAAGADVITLGDHTWQRKEARDFLASHSGWIIRPANYPDGAPGQGFAVVQFNGIKIGVCNLLGRVFINNPLECPFKSADKLLEGPLKDCTVKILDMHAEATSEKIAMARYLDGRLSLQVGTHTHVPTADEQIFPGGTGYVSDLGMTGSGEGVIGMDKEVALARFLTGMPHAYKIASGPGVMHGVLAEIDTHTGKTVAIRRVRAGEDGVVQ